MMIKTKKKKLQPIKNEGFLKEFKKSRTLFLMILPSILLVLIINYIPMSGMILAFKDFRYDLGIFGSAWSGLGNFKFFFQSGTGLRVTMNTVFYNTINLITSQLLSMLIAILLTEVSGKIVKKFCQSVIFLPYFISWIIVGSFVYNIFNYETGILNSVLKGMGTDPVNMYSMPSAWIIVIILFNSWKWVGYNSIIYIAAIMSIDMECYEAADIDGANIFQKIKYITMPGIKPTVIVMLLLNVGRIMRGDFQMFYQIVGNNGQLYKATDVIDTFVFRSLLTSGDMGMTAAATLYQSVLCFVIICTVNAIVKKVEPEYALF